MKIGFCNNPREDIIKEIEWIGNNGFDFVDVFLEEDATVPGNFDPLKVKETLDKHGLGAVGHMAWYIPIGSPIGELREFSVRETKRYLEVFSQIGVKLVTLHANWAGSLFSDDECIAFQAEVLNKIVEAAKDYGIEIMYEHIGKQKETPENIKKLLDSVPGLHLHVDIGHANLHGRKPEQMFEAFSDRIKHVHLNDNDGSEDQHQPVGGGTIDFEELFEVMKKHYDGTITLEIFTGKEDVLESKKKVKEIWERI